MLTKRLVAAAGFVALIAWPCGIVLAHDGHEGGHYTFAAGEPGNPAKPARTVAVILEEKPDGSMIISPPKLDVAVGEQVRFEVKNAGKATHEFMLDSMAHNAKHKLAMQKNPEMEHDDPNGKTLDPGESTEIVWRFTKAGTFEFACLIPGHYEAGMHGIVTVRK